MDGSRFMIWHLLLTQPFPGERGRKNNNVYNKEKNKAPVSQTELYGAVISKNRPQSYVHTTVTKLNQSVSRAHPKESFLRSFDSTGVLWSEVFGVRSFGFQVSKNDICGRTSFFPLVLLGRRWASRPEMGNRRFPTGCSIRRPHEQITFSPRPSFSARQPNPLHSPPPPTFGWPALRWGSSLRSQASRPGPFRQSPHTGPSRP